MAIVKLAIDFLIHLDVYLGQIISTYGILTYAILFVVIFIETGLVFMPFLPGDSLLFASGAFAALGALNIFVFLVLFGVAPILIDTLNYCIVHFFGEKIVSNPKIPINEEHIQKTEDFFKKYGGKTIILARFVPIVRTFAPFVAGAGQMNYTKFLSFNLIGGLAWVLIGSLAGYFFGNIPFVRDNFSLVIIGVIFISVIPIFVEFVKSKRNPS